MNIIIESITPARYRPPLQATAMWNEYSIRCWREESDYNTDIKVNTRLEIESVLFKIKEWLSVYEVAQKLIEMDRMNAVEVKDMTGEGCVLYKNWP